MSPKFLIGFSNFQNIINKIWKWQCIEWQKNLNRNSSYGFLIIIFLICIFFSVARISWRHDGIASHLLNILLMLALQHFTAFHVDAKWYLYNWFPHLNKNPSNVFSIIIFLHYLFFSVARISWFLFVIGIASHLLDISLMLALQHFTAFSSWCQMVSL